MLGQPQDALDYYKHSLQIKLQLGERVGESVLRYNIAILHYDKGQFAEAVAQLRRVVELDEQVEHPDLESDRAMLVWVEAEWAQQRNP